MRVDPEKLISALIASHPGQKLDYHAIARMYGDGATYNSVEHKFRKYRKDAEKLRAEAAEGNTSPNFRPQPPSTRTPRTRQPSSKSSTVTPTSRKRANTGKSKALVVIRDDTDEEMSPVKPEIKRENQATRDLLGIVKIKDDSDESNSPPPLKKRKRESLLSTSAAEDICSLSAFNAEAAAFHQNSQENGYAVKTIFDITDDNLANNDDIELEAEATQSEKQVDEDEYGDFDEI